MVSCLTLCLTVLNFVILIGICLFYFKETYTIVDLQTWNTIVQFYNTHVDEYNENGEPIKEEKVGGFGFQVCNEFDEEDEENDR